MKLLVLLMEFERGGNRKNKNTHFVVWIFKTKILPLESYFCAPGCGSVDASPDAPRRRLEMRRDGCAGNDLIGRSS